MSPLLLAAGACVGLVVCTYSLLRPWVGIVFLVLLQVPLAGASEGLSPYEAGFVAVFVATMAGWVVQRILEPGTVSGTRTRYAALILAFFALCVATWPIARQNGVETTTWLRGWYRMSVMAVVFPVSSEFLDVGRRRVLLTTYLTASTLIIVHSFLRTVGTGNIFVVFTETGPLRSPVYLWGSALAAALVVSGTRLYPGPRLGVPVLGGHIWRSVVNFRRQPIALVGGAIVLVAAGYRRTLARRGASAGELWRRLAQLATLAGATVLSLYLALHTQINALASAYWQRFRPGLLSTGLQSRIGANHLAIDRFREQPILGIGFGSDLNLDVTVSQAGIPGASLYRQASLGTIHSMFVHLLVYGGILVTLPILLLLLVGAVDALRLVWNRRLDDLDFVCAMWALLGILMVLAQGVASVNGLKLETWLFVGIALGLTSILDSQPGGTAAGALCELPMEKAES